MKYFQNYFRVKGQLKYELKFKYCRLHRYTMHQFYTEITDLENVRIKAVRSFPNIT